MNDNSEYIRGRRLTNAESMYLMFPDLPDYSKAFEEVLKPFMVERGDIANMDSVYMIIETNKETGKQEWHKSGRGYTPFTTTSTGRVKGELTRCSKSKWSTYKLVKIENVSEVV